MSEPAGRLTRDEIFEAVAEAPPERRAEILDRLCGEDAGLRADVEALLAADEAAGGDGFLGSALLGKSIAPLGSRDASSENSPADAPAAAAEPSDPANPRSDSAGGRLPAAAGGRFRILGKHQQGGLGEVLLALDRDLNREVAIKQVRPRWRDHTEARQRFLQEAEITGRLEHPGVVPVYAMGTWDDGRDYYAMRFIEGQTLREVIDAFHADRQAASRSATASLSRRAGDRSIELQLRHLLTRFVDVCNTVDYAHSRRVIHRDLKPSNIMVGPYGETLVVDWGLAKFLDTPAESSMTMQFLKESGGESGSTPTVIGGAVGTPQYMSPEQARGDIEAIGVGTDIFLLGATLYHLLAGVPPHRESSLAKLIELARRGEVPRPRTLVPEVPPALEAICLRAMARDPASRYRTAAELAADAERWMADEPVTAYRDPPAVRAARWLRRHRAVAYSGLVASVLLVVGSITGSLIYNTQRGLQLKAERQRNQKELELQAERSQRLGELRAVASAAERFAGEETRVGRYSSALGFLQGAIEALGDEGDLADVRGRLEEKRRRLDRLVDFYRHGQRAETENFLSRDTQAIIACKAALDAVGVWSQPDWWNHLPDEELTDEQTDALRWDVYQKLIMLDGLLVKRMGVMVAGQQTLSVGRLLSGFIGTDRGMPEAESAVAVSDRVSGFRLAEAARWYRGMATSRLRRSLSHQVDRLGAARNPSDAQSLGVLSFIADQDPAFAFFFQGYEGDDALAAARELFTRSIIDRPNHYWTQLLQGHTEYLLVRREAERAPRLSADSGSQRFEPILRTFGQCIALHPERCFAYADRASLFRFQAEQFLSGRSPATGRGGRAEELLRRSLADAERAAQLGTDQPWVDWHYGLALHAVGQIDQAIERLLRASRRTYSLPMGKTRNRLLIRVDDLRGRLEVIELLERLLAEQPEQARYRALYASVRLNQGRFDDAIAAAERALAIDNGHPHALAVRGMARLESGRGDRAGDDFERCLDRQPDHVWACYGAAICREAAGEFAAALELYRRTIDVAEMNEHRAAAWLGVARTLAATGQLQACRPAVREALREAPSSDLTKVLGPLRMRLDKWQRDRRPAEAVDRLRELIAFVEQLHEESSTRIDTSPAEVPGTRLALLNGGFELELRKYWGNASGPTWATFGGNRSRAEITSAVARRGRHSLHVRGDSAASLQRAASPEDRSGPSFAATSLPAANSFGVTGQSFPGRAGRRYRVRLWAKAASLGDGAVWLRDGGETALIRFPAGTYDWTRLEGELTAPVNPVPGTGGFAEIRLELVSGGPGEVWVDDLKVESLAASTPE